MKETYTHLVSHIRPIICTFFPDHMQIQFKERFTVASQQEKENINTCLQTLVCLSQQSSADKSCSQLELQCVNDVSPEFPGSTAIIYFQTESTEDR